MKEKKLQLPLSAADISELCAGDACLLSGPVFTARDAGHMRLLQALENDDKLPFALQGQAIFYAGPTPSSAGRPLGSVGPTTASRMDFAAPKLYKAGIVASIGKGTRSNEVKQACIDTKSIYFAAVGGSAALLAICVINAQTIAWQDLGTEALRKLELKDFPCFVAYDIYGGDIYAI